MKKTFGHRVMVVGLLASLIANPAWALITVTVNPAAGSTRTKTQSVLGHGTIAVMQDDVMNWNWKFGFGTKDDTGTWMFELEKAFTPNPTSWGKGLNAPPWGVSPNMAPPNETMQTPDHFARVTREWALNILGPTEIEETDMHTVTN